MRIIKSYFLILLIFSSTAYAQPGSRIVYSSKYLKAPGFIADSSFKAPSDTTVNKTGFAVKGTTAYIGDGVKWTAITGGSSTTEWGTIVGDLDAQTDLNAALLAKKDVADSGRAVSNYVTGWSLNKVRDSLATLIAKKQDTAAWVDYSATSTITGWSAYTTKLIQYRIVGKVMQVMVQFEGTGTGTTVSFTLPNSASAWGTQYFILHTRNNTTQSASVATVPANSSTVTVSNSASTTTSWTNAVGRDVQGQFIINIQ